MRYRYIFILLLFPSFSYAKCHPFVNYGSYSITSPNPVCVPYTGSSLGGCLAWCGSVKHNPDDPEAGLCIEFPKNNPPTRSPYVTSGQECEPHDGKNGNGPGADRTPNPTNDGTYTGDDGLVKVGTMWIGQNASSDVGPGFDAVANNIKQSSSKISKAIDDLKITSLQEQAFFKSNYMDPIARDLKTLATNSIPSDGNRATPVDYEIAGHLKSINQKTVMDPTMWNNHHADLMQMLSDVRKDMSYMGGFPNQQELININQNTNSMSKELVNISENSNSLKGTLWNISDEVQRQSYDIADMLAELKKISSGEGGNGEGGADKPCEGPLCSFSEPTVGGGSGLSSVFGEQDIAGIKQQVTERKADIQEQMDQIKGVFSPGKLQVSGSYDNDYHDINGAKIDLSGKSNIELFFSLGPKQVLWFLAVLIAFGILLGGRKDA